MLTPEEIQSREFLVSLRGYDRDEVHAFLDEVAEAFAQLLADGGADVATTAAPQAAPEPAAEPEAAEPPANPFAAIGAETQRILEAAQAAGDEIRRRAEAEAETAREEALAEAREEVDRLRAQAAATQQQLDELESRRTELAQRLRQTRESVDVALLELEEDPAADAPADATTSVLAAEPEVEEPAVAEPEVEEPAVAEPETRLDLDEIDEA